ncbi:NAD(P)/FAD-dependent oxidoreductase [Ichthyenterobacterium magnum]|uniref:Glycine/D-amino acid oxidase-like deaminating enzyme n=1 Tax=Ichthyenterobacterium magnum TaxID=1230530 RepID=A0A420DVJ1_9FLAO|nr:FAD-dependent oxidoreductase [Ichthyenterobacterium magnum]RKE98237.1 glycine/D-amino acid oxidase-like deaminating enzyme [Ichthyenterobacterium magnum]
MKNVDYIIVGSSLAGISFSEVLRANNKSFIVFDNDSQQSSIVAAGLYNPVILKRFTEVWQAKAQLDLALPKYKALEDLLNVKLDYKIPVYRRFTSIEEQNKWFTAADKPSLEHYLSTTLKKNVNANIDAPFGFGEVLQTGRIDTKALIKNYRNYLVEMNQFVNETFNYQNLSVLEDKIEYQDYLASNIVFAEGFGVRHNPFFKSLPLNVAKGELITIKAPDLNIDFTLKASVFIVPIEDDLYWVGATYNWKDTTNSVTEEGKNELVNKLKKIITCDFKVVNQVAGIRPTVIDRRPLVGAHEIHSNMYVLNGLGTRGVIIGPYVAEQLYEFIENKLPLDNAINVKRFIS